MDDGGCPPGPDEGVDRGDGGGVCNTTPEIAPYLTQFAELERKAPETSSDVPGCHPSARAATYGSMTLRVRILVARPDSGSRRTRACRHSSVPQKTLLEPVPCVDAGRSCAAKPAWTT